MKKFLIVVSICTMLFSCVKSQNEVEYNPRLVGGPCEGCEAIFEYGDRLLTSVDTLPGFLESDVKLKLSGTVFKNDGKTPAKDVIIYIYQTNQGGVYATKGDEEGWARRHGYIRGWIKTGEDGKYTFYTLKPGTYPDRTQAAHIHPTILEPDGKYYWLQAFHFKGDPLLSKDELNPKSPRGGAIGILDLFQEGDLWIAEQDIILGKNIENYK